ncbi:hypothetical protein PI125_g8730 [Phytophthora idaei]|nr:hypothetical protein PI125_g8730 [Phytophthora idaei]
MFIKWRQDGVGKAQTLRLLNVDKKTAEKYLGIVDEYEAYRLKAT